MHFTINERAGHCRWCGCTERRACPGGCAWANPARTLCDRCVLTEHLVSTAAGRGALASIVESHYQAAMRAPA